MKAWHQVFNLQRGLQLRRESSLDAFHFHSQLLQRATVQLDFGIIGRLLLNSANEVLHNLLIKVTASQMRVAIGCQDLKDTIFHG
mmetsp:Transcript_31941/g.52724  ORF Transcript_31941/g.52724 Transcript_31941/m.52724 type:complete len:85 (-) Transcript_31941:839-1093(-)